MLTTTAAMGPYFALHGGAATAPLSPQQLYEPRLLHSLLGEVGEQIGTDEPRVAASTLQYGFAARCWSLVLGAWQCGSLVIDMSGLTYVVIRPGSVELTLTDLRAWDCASLASGQAAEIIADSVVTQLTSLHTALRDVTHLADGMLWGNAASALISAAHTVTATHPGEQLTVVTAAILSRAPLADRLVTTPVGAVQRRSCCLWYRTRDRDNCGDCPLTGRPVMRQ